MSSENLLKTIDNNMGDSLLNDSGYLQSDATAKRVDQKKLEAFSISHKRSNNYNEINLEFLENLFLEALKNEDQFINQKSSLQATTLQEQWLAPRIHYGLRLTRYEASNPEVWNYLALKFDHYVARRWSYDEKGLNTNLSSLPKEFHFLFKQHSRHQIAKLWWMAEMTRNAGTYHKIAGIINTDMINYCLDITAPNFNIYTLAILNIEKDILDDGKFKLDSLWLRAIYRIINRKIIHEGGVSKVQFDIDESESQKWFNEEPDLKYTKIDSKLPPAPKDILVEEKQIKKVVSWIRSGIKAINENEYEFLRKHAIEVLTKEKRPMSTKEITDVGFDKYEFFNFDWQKRELEFAFSLDPKSRIVKKGSKWELS
jgi:hypothetical protein